MSWPREWACVYHHQFLSDWGKDGDSRHQPGTVDSMLHMDGEPHTTTNRSHVNLEAELCAGGFPLKNLVIAVGEALQTAPGKTISKLSWALRRTLCKLKLTCPVLDSQLDHCREQSSQPRGIYPQSLGSEEENSKRS